MKIVRNAAIAILLCAGWPCFAAADAPEAIIDESPIASQGEDDFDDSDACCPEPCCSDGIYLHPSRLTLTGVFGRGFGEERRYGTLSLFLAREPFLDTWQPFIDLRAHFLKDSRWAANAGLGLRYLDVDHSRVWGANVYYDYRNGHHGHYNQIGVGLETLGECWDLRINGYFPVGTKSRFSKPRVFDDYIGDFVMVCREDQFALTGAGAEVGKSLYDCGCFHFYTALGTYYYHSKHCDDFWGGLLRVKAFYSEYASLEVKATYDKRFHTNVQALVSLTLPFELFSGCCECAQSLCGSLLWQPVVREEVIKLDRSCCWKWNF